MTPKVILEVERIIRLFFWKDENGSKINHSRKWESGSKAQCDRGLGISGLKLKSMDLLAKCRWRYMFETDSLW